MPLAEPSMIFTGGVTGLSGLVGTGGTSGLSGVTGTSGLSCFSGAEPPVMFTVKVLVSWPALFCAFSVKRNTPDSVGVP